MKRLKGETFYHDILRIVSFHVITNYMTKTTITPNQITIFRNILLLLCFYLFTEMNYLYIIGFILFQIFELLDSVDGDLARYKNMGSKLGVWLEIFFDAILTPVWGVLGFLFAYIAYSIDQNLIYFFLWGFIGFSNNLEKSFLIHFRGVSKGLEEAEHGHIYFGFKGVSLKEKMRNFIIVSKSWENQWLLFGGLIYVLFDYNLFMYIWIWLLLLNQIHWVRLAYDGYRATKK